MRTLWTLTATALVLATCGCGGLFEEHPENNGKVNTPTIVAPVADSTANDRVQIEYHQSFYDTTAYNDHRSLIIIKDTATGKEFIGVSGLGITELGSHMAGKVPVTDEH